MGTPQRTPFQRRLTALLGCTMAGLTLFLPTASAADASDVATLAARLAADTKRLSKARTELARTGRELRVVNEEHRRIRADVELRLVAIYKHGGSNGTLTRMASGDTMGDVGDRLEALDHVAQHDAKALRRWQRLDDRRTKLIKRRAALRREVSTLTRAVVKARERLSAAERALAKAREAARREAARMARIQDSPLLPKVGNPENRVAGQAAASDPEGAPEPQQTQPIGFQQSGEASMYSDSFTGEETANGEHYDPGAFTAAHPSLPFGTWVTVSGAGGSVAVRINDRGPFVGGRVIDLSRAAAAAIGLPGIGNVTLSVAA